MRRVIVCGGRDYQDRERVLAVLALLDRNGLTIVHGGASGADYAAQDAAQALGIRRDIFPAEWQKHGKAAGPIRNQQMLDAGTDLVIAFPGGRGTADMVRRATEAGVPVLCVQERAPDPATTAASSV